MHDVQQQHGQQAHEAEQQRAQLQQASEQSASQLAADIGKHLHSAASKENLASAATKSKEKLAKMKPAPITPKKEKS
jgi:hypothetical protein